MNREILVTSLDISIDDGMFVISKGWNKVGSHIQNTVNFGLD